MMEPNLRMCGSLSRRTISKVPMRLNVEPLEEGGFLATSPDVPGLVAEGRSIEEATRIAHGLASEIVESCIEHGDPLPSVAEAVQR